MIHSPAGDRSSFTASNPMVPFRERQPRHLGSYGSRQNLYDPWVTGTL